MEKLNVVENPTKEEHGFEVMKMDLINLRVCSKLPADKIETQVNRHFQSGTTMGWILRTDGKAAPVNCGKGDGSIHYMFSC